MVNPALVEVTRGNMVESLHRGRVAVVDTDGHLVAGWGDVEAPVYPRSAIKPIQALQLVESGAADHFALTARELALACASHSGEDTHTRAVAAWLSRIGLDDEALGCGVHWPKNNVASRALARAGEEPTALHNNCSGKHAGFLTTAVHLGETPDGYTAPGHPTQRRWHADLAALSGANLSHAHHGIDGCGIPVVALPLAALARAFAHFADPGRLEAGRADAIARLRAAVAAEPLMIAGTGRLCTDLASAFGGDLLAKVGAEGVYVAALPRLGYGIAIKADDGATRAAQAALLAVLDHLGAIDERRRRVLGDWIDRPLRNRAGRVVGSIRAADGWPD